MFVFNLVYPSVLLFSELLMLLLLEHLLHKFDCALVGLGHV